MKPKTNVGYIGNPLVITTMDKSDISVIQTMSEELEKLEGLIKSDSVYYALRFADKSPSRCGVDECEDNDYLELYKICKTLRQPNINTDYIGQECFFIDNVTHSKKFDGASLGKSIKEGVHLLYNLPIIWFEKPFLGFNWQYKRNVRF